MKRCFKCGQEKLEADFYRHPQMADGLLGKCVACARKDAAATKLAKSKDPQWVEAEKERLRAKSRAERVRYPKQVKARSLVQAALQTGRLQRMPCEVCGSVKSEAHHDDHSRPLDVRWLCKPHHAEADNEIRRANRLKRHKTTP